MKLQTVETRRIAGWLAVAMLVGSSGAFADDQNEPAASSTGRASWHTRYGFTTHQTCVRTPFVQPPGQGIDPATQKLLVDGEEAEAVGAGVMDFTPDGKVTASVLGAELTLNKLVAGTAPLSTGISYNCQGQYRVQPDQSIAVTFPSCTVNTGNPNVVVTVAPLNLKGYVSAGRKAINLSLVDGGVQTVSVADPSGRVLQARQRLCIQTMSLDKL